MKDTYSSLEISYLKYLRVFKVGIKGFLVLLFSILLVGYITPFSELNHTTLKYPNTNGNLPLPGPYNVNKGSLSIVLKNGPFFWDTGTQGFISISNIAEWNSRILPSFFYMQGNTYSGSSLLEQENFLIQQIINFHILHYSIPDSEYESDSPTMLSGSLKAIYHIQCLTLSKLSNLFCERSKQDFLNTFWNTDIVNHIEEVQQVFNIIDESDKKLLCEGVYNHSKVYKISSDQFFPLMKKCGKDFEQKYLLQHEYLQESKEEKTYIQSVIYKNPQINALKIMSLMQRISLQIRDNKTTIQDINSYLGFLEGVLHNPNSIESKYLELAYLFHNSFLLPQLKIASYNQGLNKNNLFEIFSQKLEALNTMSPAGYSGLDSYVTSNEITSIALKNGLLSIQTPNISFGGVINSTLKNFPWLVVTQQTLNDNNGTALLKGVILIDNKTVRFEMKLKKLDNTVGLSSLVLPDYAYITTLIGQIIQNNTLPQISTLYEVIKNNINWGLSQSDFCSSLQSQQKSLLGSQVAILECTPQLLSLKKGNDITTIHYNSYNQNSVESTSQNIEKSANQILKDTLLTQDTILDFAQYLMSTISASTGTNETGTFSNAMIVFIDSLVNQYLGVHTDSISAHGQNYIVTFKLKNYVFEGIMSKNSSSWSITIDKVGLQNNINSSSTLHGISFDLRDGDLYMINHFLLDPRDYIKLNDQEGYKTLKFVP